MNEEGELTRTSGYLPCGEVNNSSAGIPAPKLWSGMTPFGKRYQAILWEGHS